MALHRLIFVVRVLHLQLMVHSAILQVHVRSDSFDFTHLRIIRSAPPPTIVHL
jgi:hypothetical protein